MSFNNIQMHIQSLLEQVSPAIDLLFMISIGSALLALIFLVLYVGQRHRIHHLETQTKHLMAVATRAKEILTTTPDGLFLWDHILGGIACSSRLAELLDLKEGTNARYDDIRNCFEGSSLKDLERGVSALRANGTPFNLQLTCREKTLEAIGSRAQTKFGEPVADIVWIRDVSNILIKAKTHDNNIPQNSLAQNTSGLDDRHLTVLLDAMPIPIWLRDSKLEIAFTNRAAQSIVNPDPRMAEAARIKGEACTERVMLDIHGSPRLMDITEISLGFLSDNLKSPKKLGGSVGFAIDRVEQAENEAINEHRFAPNSVLHTLDTAIAIFDANKQLHFTNTAYAKLFGLNPNWLAEKPLLMDILDRQRDTRNLPEVADFQAFKIKMEGYFDTLTTPLSDLIHLPDGRTLKQTISPNPNGGLIFALNDISGQLILERSMKEASAVQRETLDNLHEGVAVFGSDGRLKLFNPVYVRIWDLNPKQLKEEPHISEIIDKTRQIIPPPSGYENWKNEEWLNYRESLTLQMLSRTTTSGQMHLRNGKVIDHSSIPLPDGAMLLSFLDVTDSANVEAALRERAEAFQEADRLKTEFIAKVSYEIRTPLNTVIGFADMLSQNLFGDLNKRQSEYAKGILSTSRALVNILSDILDLASIEAGWMELNKDTFDVHAILVSSLNLVQERTLKKKQKLLFDCPPDIGWIIGDEKRLKQVLFNLLSNAVSFTPYHGEIQLKARRVEDALVFSVRDSGVGIPSNGRNHLFRPFEQGKTKPVGEDLSGTTSGKGLGLSIVRNLIELHGGNVELKSQPGRGTTITCRIPTRDLTDYNKSAFQAPPGPQSGDRDPDTRNGQGPAFSSEPTQKLTQRKDSTRTPEFHPETKTDPITIQERDTANYPTEQQTPLKKDGA